MATWSKRVKGLKLICICWPACISDETDEEDEEQPRRRRRLAERAADGDMQDEDEVGVQEQIIKTCYCGR